MDLALVDTADLDRFLKSYGGERGIRTLDRGLTYTPLAGERLQPLGHLSGVRIVAHTTRVLSTHLPNPESKSNKKSLSDAFLVLKRQHQIRTVGENSRYPE